MRAQPGGIRVAVVGVGHWGSRHLRVLRSATGVSAVVGVDERFSGGGADSQQAGVGVAAYRALEEALPHVDAVVIATPPASHAGLGLTAIAAGKHVLVEKPLATTTDAARTLVEAAGAAGVVLMPGHTFEHNAAVRKLRDLVRDSQLGRLFYLDCARLNLGLYQPDVNVILDLAAHDISIANFVLGSRPATVEVWGSRYIHPEHEDVAYLRLDYADLGVRANIHVSWLYPTKVRRITAVGSRRMATYDDLADAERIRVFDRSAIPPEEGDGPLSHIAYHLGDVVSPFIPFAEPLAVQDQHFIDCIGNGSPPAVDGSNGLAVVQALECAQISLREQRPVALAEVARAGLAARPGRGAALAGARRG
ncbi:MAG TPA: Gfo/Idh/MocA family oxidoreductase [Streptosporangiaceae bacterium]|nr:Gfo/Idh/MocA family oxidoreductase [Streptosporangiaceae bacterium]